MRTLSCWPGASLVGSVTTTVWPLAVNWAAAPLTCTFDSCASPVLSVTRLNVMALSLPPVVLVTVATLEALNVPLDQWTKALTLYVARSDRSLGVNAAAGLLPIASQTAHATARHATT